MADSPLSNASGSPDGAVVSLPPAEHNLFRSPSLPFAFLRVLCYLVLANGIAAGLGWLARFFVHGVASPYSPGLLMTGESIALAGAFSAAWVMSRVEKRPFGAYGFPLRGAFGKTFWQGAGFGAVEISVVVGLMAALGSYHFGAIAVHGLELLRWAAFWAIFFLSVGLYEEFAFRGYVQFTLSQGMSFWPAAVLLSCVFGLRHTGNPGETWPGIAGIILIGLFWCFTLRRTGNLWFAVGMHASFDFGETFLYSVPDSGVIFPGHLSNATLAGPTWITGGTAGPEASILDLLVILTFFFVFHRLYPANPVNQPKSES